MDALVFKNKFGQLFESHFSILQTGFMQDYSYENLRKIKLIKSRNYQLNLLLLVGSIAAMVLGFYLRSFSPLLLISGVSISLCLLYLCIRTKKYRYQLQIRTIDSGLIYVDVDVLIHEDAKTLVRKLNRKLKEEPDYLQAV